MAVPLDTLVTSRPSISALFTAAHDEAPEVLGQHLFLHHVLHAICQDSCLDSADEQIRGVALGIWYGLDLSSRDFWSGRAVTAKLVQSGREDFLLLDASTPLSRDHVDRAHTALVAYKQALAADIHSVADTASVADTEFTDLTEDDINNETGADGEAGDDHNNIVANDGREPSIEIEGWGDIGLRVWDSTDVPAIGVFGNTEQAEVKLDSAHDEGDNFDRAEAMRTYLQQNVSAEASHDGFSEHSEPAITQLSKDEEDLDTIGYSQSKGLEDDADKVMSPPLLRANGVPPNGSSSALDASAATTELLAETANASVTESAWSFVPTSGPLDWAEESQEQAEQDAAARAEQKTEPVDPTADVDIPKEDPTRILWISNLRPSVDLFSLKATFLKFGVIESATRYSTPQQKCHSAYIWYKTVEAAIAAKASMNGKNVLNYRYPLRINFAEGGPQNGSNTAERHFKPDARQHAAKQTCAIDPVWSEIDKLDEELEALQSLQSPTNNSGPGHRQSPQPRTAYPTPPISPSTDPKKSTPHMQKDTTFTLIEAEPSHVSTGEPATSSAEQLTEVKRPAVCLPLNRCQSGSPSTAKASENGKLAATKPARSVPSKPVPQPKVVVPRPKRAPSMTTVMSNPTNSTSFDNRSRTGTPLPVTPREHNASNAVQEIPLAKWETPVKVRDFGSAASDEPEPPDDGGKGKAFFLFHALPVVCEDLEVDEPDAYVISIAEAMWQELSAQTRRSWIEDSRSLRGYSMRKPGLLSSEKRFQESRFTKNYRSQILKTLAQRNGGELKYLQPELKKLLSSEKRLRRAQREQARRNAEYAAEKAEQAACDEAQEAKVASSDNTDEQLAANLEANNVEATLQSDQRNLEEPVVTTADRPERMDSAVLLETATDLVSEPEPESQPRTSEAETSMRSIIADDPPPPYENDGAIASARIEAASSKKKARAASRPSVKESAKSAMKKMSWNRATRA